MTEKTLEAIFSNLSPTLQGRIRRSTNWYIDQGYGRDKALESAIMEYHIRAGEENVGC